MNFSHQQVMLSDIYTDLQAKGFQTIYSDLLTYILNQ